MKRFTPKASVTPGGAQRSDKPGELTLEGDDTAVRRRLGINDKASLSGSNPYNLDPLAKKKPVVARRTDLRELSEWIKLKREVEALKKSPDPEEGTD